MADETDYNKLALQLALNTQAVSQLSAMLTEYIKSQDKLYQDHEQRLRGLETDVAAIRVDTATFRERLTIAQLIQSAFTTLAAIGTYLVGKQ